MHQSICPHLTVKALLIVLPKSSLIESRQCNGKQKKKKQREDAAQKGKNYANKSLMGPQENIPCPPPPPLPLFQWACWEWTRQFITGTHKDTITYVFAYEPWTIRGWWKLASPFFSPEGTGLKCALSSSVRILWTDSMSENAAVVIGRGIPFLCHLGDWIIFTRKHHMQLHDWYIKRNELVKFFLYVLWAST